MDLHQLANLGEFVGGVAVLATLVYLAAQVRQGNRQTAANLSFHLLDMSSEIARSAQDREHAELIVKMKHDETLDGVEEEQADAYVFRSLNYWNAAQQAYDVRLMNPTLFRNVCADVERVLKDSPGFQRRSAAMLTHFPLANEYEVFRPVFAERRDA